MSLLPQTKAAKRKPGDKRSGPERALAMCTLIAGGMSLSKAAQAEGFDSANFLRLVRKDEDMRVEYETALHAKAERDADERIEILDAAIQLAKERGHDASSFVTASVAKVRALEWNAEKGNPKKYGAKVEANVTVGLATLIEQSLRKPANLE